MLLEGSYIIHNKVDMNKTLYSLVISFFSNNIELDLG